VVTEEKEDELVTRASAQTITWFRNNLKREIKQALKELYSEWWRDVLHYVYRSNWLRLLAGLATLASALIYWLKENA
jgi:hypothetical protein